MRDLDELLKPPPPADDSRPDDPVYQRTTVVLRHRRWLRNGLCAAAFAACFAAGMATMKLWLTTPVIVAPDEKAVQEPEPVAPRPTADPYQNDSPNSLERWAGLAEGDKRLELLRRAGDRHLERGDELSALRCYRKVLDLGGEKALTVQEDDTWLFMSMKLARK